MYSLRDLQLFGSLAIPIYLTSMLTCENPYFLMHASGAIHRSKMHISVVSGSKFKCYSQVYCFIVTLHVLHQQCHQCTSVQLTHARPKMLYMPLPPGKHNSWLMFVGDQAIINCQFCCYPKMYLDYM